MDSSFSGFDCSLRDGRVVHIRGAGSADEAAILRAFERMGAESRYLRFMRVVDAPDVERLRRVIAAFPASGQWIVATAGDADIVGSAVFMIGHDPQTCEFSTSVTDDYGGVGLGRALLTALIEAAKRRGLREMEGFVLARNRPMLRLAARLGFSIAPDPDDPAVRICRLRLSDR